MGVRGSNQTRIASYGWTLSWRRQRSLNLALELADCCACGEAANVACRLMGSFCGQGGGEEEAGERRRHEAAAVSIGAVAGHAKAKAGFLGDGLHGSRGARALSGILDR